MKTPAVLIPLLLAAGTLLSSAQRAPHPPMHGGGGPGPGGLGGSGGTLTEETLPPEPSVTEEELGSARDKFVAFRKLVLEGERFYPKENRTLLEEHRRIYLRLREETIAERLSVANARDFVTRLIAAGEATQTARGDAASLTDEQAATATAALDTLSKDIDAALVEKVDPDLLTPELNRREWLMDELVRELAATGASGSRTRLVNRLDSLLEAEAREKSRTPLSDTDRTKLMERSVEVWKVFLREFRS